MKRFLLISLILALCLWMCGCSSGAEESTTQEVVALNSVYVYYPEGDQIARTEDTYQLKQPDSIIPSVEEVMSVSLDAYDGRMEKYSYMVDEDNNVTVDITMAGECSREYSLLTMAAVSDTLFQLELVESVKITLLSSDGETLDSKLILRNTFYHYGYDSSQVTKQVTFYKTNSDGDKLEALSGIVALKDDTAMVESIVEQLAAIDAIPKGTRVNTVAIIGDICYLDLSQEFNDTVDGSKSQLVVYALVNSVTGLSYINEVYVTIDGQIVDNYRGTEDLSKPLAFNKDIVK